MIIESLELKNYRNYEKLSIKLSTGTNIFYGDNAQGKTNILESVFLASTSKSYRMSKDRDLIRFGEDEAHIKMTVRKKGIPYRIDLHLRKNKTKGIAIDEMPIKRASELFGIANVICFSPEDLSLIKDGPSVRRRFMDMELCQLDKIYLYHLSRYNRTLNQRNKLLKDIIYKPSLEDTISVWDDELIKSGVKVIMIRDRFIEDLKPLIYDIHSKLSGGKEDLKVSYESDIPLAKTEEEMIENYRKELARVREQEMKQHLSLAGPHRDDLMFQIDGNDIRRFGSQGQQRTAALALKLSEIELVRRQINDNPILLLDDVLSELDKSRQQLLLQMLKDTQNIITCTGLDDFVNNRFHIDELFQVKRGTVSQVQEEKSGY